MKNFIRKRVLILIGGALVSLSVLALFVAGYAFFVQERLLESILLPYVRDMVQALSSDLAGQDGHHSAAYENHHLLTSGPSLPGGEILIVSSSGRTRSASPGVFVPDSAVLRDLMKDREGYRQIAENDQNRIVIWNTLATGDTAFFFIPREKLLASVDSSHELLLGLLLFLTLGLLALAVALWRYLVAPLRKIAGNIRGLRWGTETLPKIGASCVWEVDVLENALLQQAQNAIENTKLKENYLKSVLEVQEEERRLFSRELHDGPLQYVTATIRRIQIVSALLRNPSGDFLKFDEKVGENLAEAEKAAQFSADEIRDLCDEMSPSWLEFGLASALAELSDRAERHDGLPVVLHLSDDMQKMAIDRDKSLALLRIFQEAYSNAIRHGKASQVDVELREDKENIYLTIRDNGTGFDKSAISDERLRMNRHRGIVNMTERVSLAGGRLFIESSPNSGCAVTASVPK